VLLDLKERQPDRRARLLAALIDSLPDRDRFRVCSHLADDLDEVRAAGFRTWRTARDSRELGVLLGVGRLPDEAVSVRHSLLHGEVVRRLHERTPAIVAWTVNSAARARRLREMGVDGVTTDSAEVLHALSSHH
jgi:glycerophosphoryl diester phosphodiesterase